MLFKITVNERLDMWRAEATRLKFEKGYSWTETAEALKNFFPGKTDRQIHETVRGYLRLQPEYLKKNPVVERQEVIGIFSDVHFPFAHPNYINFIEDTFTKHGVTKVICCGDLCDQHAISRFQTETDAYSAMTEYEMALKDIQIYTRVFPEVELLRGNHCMIPARQAATLGIPEQYLKGMKELWHLPKGWNVHDQLIINDVMYEHGIGMSGKSGVLDRAINNMMSYVAGHSHAFGGVQYKSNSKMLVFGLQVGCGIDIDAYSFRYGRYNKNRETLGCGIVFDSANAIFVPMGEKYFRKGK